MSRPILLESQLAMTVQVTLIIMRLQYITYDQPALNLSN